jgi:O-antigen/teichoic acid export membrane protein
MNNNLIRNSLSSTSGFVLVAVVTFFITPLMVRGLGKNVYGIWSILISITGYFGLLDLGIRTAIVKFVSEYEAGHKYEALRRMNSVTWTLYASIGLFSWVGMVGISFLVPHIFNIEGDPAINFTLLMAIIGADVFLTFFFIIFQGNIAGHQRYDILLRNSTASLLVRAASIWYFLNIGYGVFALSIIALTSNLLGYCLNYLSYKSICPPGTLVLGVWDKQELSRIWNYSIKSFITNISDRIIYYSDSIIIGIFLSTESVTFYAIASSLIIYVRQLVLAICGVFIPAVSEANSKGEISEIHRIVVSGTKLVLFALVPISSVLLIIGGDFIRLWMGEGFEQTYYVLVILTIAQLMVLSQYGLAMALYGTSRHGLIAKANILVGALNLIFCLALVRPFGLLGVAIGSALSMAVLQLYLFPMLRMVSMPFRVFFVKAILPFLCIGSCFTLFLALARITYHPTSWMRFANLLALSLSIYLMACYTFILTKTQKHELILFAATWTQKARTFCLRRGMQ